eukprot:6466655-Lingulodinium_polyedra.AAC.1
MGVELGRRGFATNSAPTSATPSSATAAAPPSLLAAGGNVAAKGPLRRTASWVGTDARHRSPLR